jgi:hypothetical protein
VIRTAAFALALALGGSVAVAQAATAVDCAYRTQKTAGAWAIAQVRVQSTSENAFSGRGDHCDEQRVTGLVSKVVKGPLAEGQAVAFSLTQGACGDPNSVNDDFTRPGADLVVALQRDAAGGVYQVRAETAADYAAREASCR